MRTLRQVSAGGVVYRWTQSRPEVILIARDHGKVWCLPKGLVERGEGVQEAALREVREETGVRGEIVGKLGQINYWYVGREGEEPVRFFKTVHFYLMRYLEGDVQRHDWEVEDARWFPLEEAIARATYKGEREILEKARRMIMERPPVAVRSSK
ncbi:MAG: NUDIX hydrolase [Blastocatellia bacterium]|nr:NUDIX hydrolase [Blastocatellia bacterium]MCS7157669.1 NUDIX hydrolase [Blastocatellia bacterium]MCX7751934.1 NUDIX hydrolase [Blastocatellia bacterium]MDW8167040.1 NUDIX hydrolase [Acidobacteriota bacterium]MDW8257144.1 NUDIX hydrolase [Acidobacteriota bacterium]